MKLFHKSTLLSISATCIAILAIGCAPMSTQNATATGAVAGGLLGAAAGGIIGHDSGRAAEGALAGGLAGGALGAQNGGRIFGGDGTIQQVKREQ